MKKEEKKEKAKGVTGMRAAFMLLGILLIGICVTCYRLSEFGVDPFSGMNLGISGFIGWSFGNWQLVSGDAVCLTRCGALYDRRYGTLSV